MKSTGEVAKLLDLDDSHVRRLAIKHGIGEKVSPRSRLFSDADVEAIRSKLAGSNMGRPRKAREAVAVASE
jgi:hypothetical protein